MREEIWRQFFCEAMLRKHPRLASFGRDGSYIYEPTTARECATFADEALKLYEHRFSFEAAPGNPYRTDPQ